MRSGWLSWSAAALGIGGVSLVLGALSLPASPTPEELLRVVAADDQRWLLACTGFFMASYFLTLGLPALATMFPTGRRRVGLIGAALFAGGTIGTAGYAALLAFFRAVLISTDVTVAEMTRISQQPSVIALIVIFMGTFYAGELLIAIALWRARTIHRWVPTLMFVHVGLFFLVPFGPDFTSVLQSLCIGMAFLAIAMRSSERATKPLA